MTVAALIVAAGRGTRAGDGVPKQWRQLAGMSVAERALRVFDAHVKVDNLTLVLNSNDTSGADWPKSPQADLVTGGATRTASVRAGLEALDGRFDHVLIHDAARPLVSPALIDRVLDALATHSCAAPGLPITDTLWQGVDGMVIGTYPRDGLIRAQTPQGFRLADILAAYRAHSGEATDDVGIALAAGLDVAIVQGDERNLKITTAEDFDRAALYLGQ